MAEAAKRQTSQAGAALRVAGEGTAFGRIDLSLTTLAVILRARRKRRTAQVKAEEISGNDRAAMMLTQAGRSPISVEEDPASGGVTILAGSRTSPETVRQMIAGAFGWLVAVEWNEPG